MARMRGGEAAYGASMAGVALVLMAALTGLAGPAWRLLFGQPAPGGWQAGAYGLFSRLFCTLPPALLLGVACRRPEWPARGPGRRLPLLPELGLFLGAASALSLALSFLWNLAGPVGEGAAAALPTVLEGRILYALATCLAAPLLEEWLFRGGVQRLLRPWGPRFAMVCTALLFTLMHAGLWDMPSALLLGLLLGRAMEKWRSLGFCIALHIANNLLAFAVLAIGERGGNAAWLLAPLAVGGLTCWGVHALRRRAGPFWPAKDAPLPGGRGRAGAFMKAPGLAVAFVVLAVWRVVGLLSD